MRWLGACSLLKGDFDGERQCRDAIREFPANTESGAGSRARKGPRAVSPRPEVASRLSLLEAPANKDYPSWCFQNSVDKTLAKKAPIV